MVFHTRLVVFFAIPAPLLVCQSKSPKDREIGTRFAPLWEVVAPKLQEIFPDEDAKGNCIVPDRRNGVGKPLFKLAPFGIGQLFTPVSPDLCVPGVSSEVFATGHLSSQHGQCVMAALSPHRFFAAWRVEAPFSAVSLSDGFYTCALFDSLPDCA